jgi:hypothetical protein
MTNSKEKFIWPENIIEKDQEKIIDLTAVKNQKYLSGKKATPGKE